MAITLGTSVRLPDGRNGIVIPSAYFLQGRVRVKVKGGRKVWISEDECTPVYISEKSIALNHEESA